MELLPTQIDNSCNLPKIQVSFLAAGGLLKIFLFLICRKTFPLKKATVYRYYTTK